MCKRLLLTFSALILMLSQSTSYAEPAGMISKASKYSVTETINKLEAVLKNKGITVVTRWSHSDKAKNVGINLRPTELILFGNPKLGSHLFTSHQTAGIDLPLKALAWQDKSGKVWLSYNDPAYIAQRHNISDRKKIITKMTNALNKLTNIATGN